MARDFHINGESMVSVKGPPNTTISSLTQLGLSDGPIHVQPSFRHKDITVDAWGGPDGPPADVQVFLADCRISITLIHFDLDVLRECLNLSMGGQVGAGLTVDGVLARAGTRMGGNLARFAAGNNYIGLNIASPVDNRPWRFLYAYLAETPVVWPLGAEKSAVQTTWRAVPYTNDPWGGGSAQPGTVAGTGAAGALLWDRNPDT